jgi:dihydrofolate reductase
MKSIIVAYDKRNGIGAANDLLWKNDLPADLKHFKNITTGSTIIMGRKTYESIGKPLPNRQNIVISSSMSPVSGIDVVHSLDEAFDIAEGPDAFVIGGGQIYKIAIDRVDRIYATEVQGEFNAEVFFPVIDKTIWKEISREHHEKDTQNKYNYNYVIYEKI